MADWLVSPVDPLISTYINEGDVVCVCCCVGRVDVCVCVFETGTCYILCLVWKLICWP